jgi:hypothetical protein
MIPLVNILNIYYIQSKIAYVVNFQVQAFCQRT